MEPRPAIAFEVLPSEERVEGEPYVARGAFDRRLDLSRAAELLTVLGRTELDSVKGTVDVGEGRLQVREDGVVVARGRDGRAADDLLERARQLLVKAELCVGCGVCVPRCPNGALRTQDLVVRLDPEGCIHCGECFGPCAVVDFPLVAAFPGQD